MKKLLILLMVMFFTIGCSSDDNYTCDNIIIRKGVEYYEKEGTFHGDPITYIEAKFYILTNCGKIEINAYEYYWFDIGDVYKPIESNIID